MFARRARGPAVRVPTPTRRDRRRRPALAALAALAAGLGLGLTAPAMTLAASTDQAVAYQLDATHDGDITGSAITAPLSQVWSISLPGAISYPLIVNGVVYVTAATTGSTGTTLYALNQATGATLWSEPLDGTNEWSGLAYDAGQVFTLSNDGVLTAFEADDGSTDWSDQIEGSSFSSAPTASAGTVYAGGSGALYAIDEASGDLNWSATVANGDESSPAVDSSGVYVNYAGNQDYAFGPLTGTQLWHYSTGSEGGGGKTPVVAAGYVFTRDASGDLLLNESTGTSAGTYTSTPAPAVGGGYAYTLSSGTLTATASSGLGSTAWTFTGDGHLDTAPLIVGSLVLEGSSTGKLFAVDATSGSTVWSLSGSGPAIAAPDEQNGTQPLTGLGAGEGTLIVPAGSTLVAYDGAGVGSGIPSNTSPPTVAGTASTGELVAADVGIWSALPTSYTYQWERCNGSGGACTNISGATGESYAPGDDDIGSTLRVSVVATNGSGSASAVTSAPSTAVALAPPSNVDSPTISGSAVQGQTLTATPGTWTGDPTSYAYRWLRCTAYSCTSESGATGSSYVVGSGDVGYQIEVEVTATNTAGASDPADSYPTSTVTGTSTSTTTGSTSPPANLTDLPLTVPSITGTPRVGLTLTVSPGVWSNPAATITFQWQSCAAANVCTNIAGATGAQLTLTAGLVGTTLRVLVTATALGRSVTSTTASTAPVTAAPPPPTAAQVAAAALAALGIRLGVVTHVSDLVHHGLSAIVHCTASCKVTIALVTTSRDHGLKGTIGGATARIRAGQTQVVVGTVSRRYDKALAKLSRLYLQVSFEIVQGHSTRRYVDVFSIKR